MHKLAEGRTAEVFTWQAGQVLKLWRPGESRETVEHEASVGRTIRKLGINAPDVLEVVEHDGRFGVIYAQVTGITLIAWMMSERIEAAAQWLGRLHVNMHRHSAKDQLPSHRLRLSERLERLSHFSPTERNVLLNKMRRLPNGDCVCHGDFHPDNVLIDGDQAVIIDWNDATSGPAIADVTRTLLIIDGAQVPEPLREMFRKAYLTEYALHQPLDHELIAHWYPVLAAVRLLENIPHESERLRDIVAAALVR